MRERFAEPIADARQRAHAIVDRRNAAWRELEEQLNREFPDMRGAARWSAAAWRQPEDRDVAKAADD